MQKFSDFLQNYQIQQDCELCETFGEIAHSSPKYVCLRFKFYSKKDLEDAQNRRSFSPERVRVDARKCCICLQEKKCRKLNCLKCSGTICVPCYKQSVQHGYHFEQCPAPSCHGLLSYAQINRLNAYRRKLKENLDDTETATKRRGQKRKQDNFATSLIWCCDHELDVPVEKSTVITCDKCKKQYCEKCLQLLDENHVCTSANVETAKTMRQISKPCPKCRVPIERAYGCAHMFCTQCKASYSWDTGQLIKNSTNPLFADEMIRNGVRPIDAALCPHELERSFFQNLPIDLQKITDFVRNNQQPVDLFALPSSISPARQYALEQFGTIVYQIMYNVVIMPLLYELHLIFDEMLPILKDDQEMATRYREQLEIEIPTWWHPDLRSPLINSIVRTASYPPHSLHSFIVDLSTKNGGYFDPRISSAYQQWKEQWIVRQEEYSIRAHVCLHNLLSIASTILDPYVKAFNFDAKVLNPHAFLVDDRSHNRQKPNRFDNVLTVMLSLKHRSLMLSRNSNPYKKIADTRKNTGELTQPGEEPVD